ncbi:hypothetical protein [Tenuibacillus multivorans]|uniref:Permuted papain-like amidase enzyme, YaeF/YiiX, C92 family n=1 Tax=Tenuibacillus multivorans TaxID=237069 RepID=A0A1H0FHX6_9BACI|nr:hypothetical protein [Tenuibacillus multivorans]GEL77673.1 hypothetical protein TMU01_19080 [Tenuibacillus multivorans]SDN94283.1 hypothetical protein SAMN05216498_0262 [Tenuibacillus multivorans]
MTDHQSVYIMLSDTGTIFTSLIKTYTRAPYNHASLSFDPELREMYSFGRKNPKNPINGGFVKEDILTGTYSRYKETTCVIYKLEVTERQVEKMKRILDVFIRNNNKFLYNILGVIGVSIKEPIEFSNSYFCSQFVAEILKRSGINLWDKLPAMVTPEDFRKNERLELIYEGKLFDFEPIKKQLKNYDE